MSGGSYDYLFIAEDLFDRYHTIEAMRDRLAELGHVGAAADTQRVLDGLDQAKSQAKSLSEVWRAVEWLDSGDSGEDQVAEAVAAHSKRSVLIIHRGD